MPHPTTKVLVTGSNGFIGKNLVSRLREIDGFNTVQYVRGDDPAQLPKLLSQVDAVIHLAGENRPDDNQAFKEVNTRLTETICEAIHQEYNALSRHIPLIFASSIQAEQDNPYGISKREAEDAINALSTKTGNPGIVFRLPGVFGKWCRPNYNSVVATFCHNIAHGLEIRVDNPNTSLQLVYIDDVVNALISALETPNSGFQFANLESKYNITLGELATQIAAFQNGRETLKVEQVGTGFTRALYATYLSFLPPDRFIYSIPQHGDERGVFVEMLKTVDSGQFSYFTAHPGVTRGGHYHHTKSEKFLVIKGNASFRFRQLHSEKTLEIQTTGDKPQVVETIPGWSHDVTNIGDEEMIVMLWANEIFDRDNPDTIASEVVK